MKCAVDMQKAFALRNAALPAERRMTFRMGVNLGDVIADREDIYGDGDFSPNFRAYRMR